MNFRKLILLLITIFSFQVFANGYVTLEFDLTEKGKAINIKVIDSNLSEEFRSVAIEKAKEFQFEPKRVNGKPVRQNALKYTMEFNETN